jgi:hypothetical protein
MTLARALRPLASRHPRVVEIAGSFDLQAPEAPADLHLDTHCNLLDTVVEATAGLGAAGNLITVQTRGTSAAGAVITVNGTDVLIEYDNACTVLDIENAITALAGADDIIGVKTPGTAAAVPLNNASHVHADTDLVCTDLDFMVIASDSGAAYDGTVVSVWADSGVGVGAYATWTPVGLTGIGVLEVHFEAAVDTRTTILAAITAALAGTHYYVVGPNGPGAIAAAGNTGLSFSTHGGAAGDNMSPHNLAGGTGYVPITTWRGMKECSGITHPSVGLYVLAFRDSYPAILDFEACIQLITAAAQQVQVGAFVAATRTVEVRVVNLGTGALEDPAVAVGDRINVTALVSNTSMGRISTV